MAWNSGTRCGVCSRFFCCPRHRLDHQAKVHADVYSNEGQDFLVQYFQRKAETILLKSQKRQITVDQERKQRAKCDKEFLSNSNNNNDKISAPKRRHDGIHKRVLTESFAAHSQRKILIPVYCLRHSKLLSRDSKSVGTDDSKSVNGSSLALKTSTPIFKALSVQSTWDDVSPASAISEIQTPLVTSASDKPQIKTKGPVTPLPSIMAKMSKYQSPSVSISDSGSRGRRVTFSLSSQLSLSTPSSATSSVLERIHEVEDKPDPTRGEECVSRDNFQCVIRSELLLQSSVHEQYIVNTESLADSPPSEQEVGFFSCVTSMFCSAVQTIPAFNYWRSARQKRTKRSRSPEQRPIEDIPHKKPCFDCDMRENPIKCRKPISSSSGDVRPRGGQ